MKYKKDTPKYSKIWKLIQNNNNPGNANILVFWPDTKLCVNNNYEYVLHENNHDIKLLWIMNLKFFPHYE